MAFFPMTFPFYFDPTDAYSPFRPLADESLRSFGATPEDPRMFLDPSFVHRPPQIETVREFDGTFNGRIFGVTAEGSREFDTSSPSSRIFGITPSVSRPFDDDTHEGRH
jgi:hypothetical protein